MNEDLMRILLKYRILNMEMFQKIQKTYNPIFLLIGSLFDFSLKLFIVYYFHLIYISSHKIKFATLINCKKKKQNRCVK